MASPDLPRASAPEADASLGMRVDPAPADRELIRRLIGHVRPHWKVFALGVVGMILTAATEPAFPALMKVLLDDGFGPQGGGWLVWGLPLAIVGLFLLRGIFTFTMNYAMSWVSQRVLNDLRREMFSRLIEMPASFYARESAGRLIARIVADVANVTVTLGGVVVTTVRDSFVIIGLMIWLFYLNWQLTLVALAVLPVIALLTRAFSRRMRRLSHDQMRYTGEMTAVVEEAIHCNPVVKVYGGQAYERARFAQANDKLRNFARRMTIASATIVPLTQISAAIAVAIVVAIALVQSQQNETTVGGFVSFITAMLMLLTPLRHLADINTQFQKALAAADAVFRFIDEPVEHDTGTRRIERARGELRFEQVHFRYPGAERDALAGIDLHVRPGETVALVGTSGGGKTTLANLLPRFYSVSSGRILLDGVSIEEITLDSLRAQIAWVSQQVMLFNDTIAANIAYGTRRDASLEEVRAAARAAHLADFIESQPEGYDTVIGDNGVRLSGGQRQRLSIARAILKNAPILILDEATSALDNESERHVQAALEELMRGRTTLVIAHRLSTVIRADRILVMSHGRIVEQGTHAELLERDGVYARLYKGEEFAA